MTAPLWPLPVSYQGARPSWQPPSADLRSKRLWVGDPASSFGMVEWPSPAPYDVPRSRGRVEHGLYGGGVAVTYFDSATRAWNLTWPALTERDWQLIAAFDTPGLMGTAPWCLLEPEGVNRLTGVQSVCGARHGTVEGWTPTGSGAVAVSSAAAAPVTPCGVMQWTPGAAGARLAAGTLVGAIMTPTAYYAAPNVPGEFVSFSVAARAVSGSGSAHVRVTGMAPDGSGTVSVDGPSTTLDTTTWRPLSVVAGPGAFGAVPWLVPSIVADSNVAFLISTPQLSYTSQPMDWALGGGVPRVHITTDLPRTLSKALWTGLPVTLTEAIAGAA